MHQALLLLLISFVSLLSTVSSYYLTIRNTTEASLKDDREFRNSSVESSGCPKTCMCKVSPKVVIVKDCSQDPFNELPDFLLLYPDTVALNITQSHLSDVPCMLSKLVQLQSLNLTSNEIHSVEWDCLKDLPKLQYVDISSNRLEILRNGSFYDFPQLTEIVIDDNNISTIECDVFSQTSRLPRLSLISMRYNNLVSLDSWPVLLGVQMRYFVLDVSHNYISHFTNHLHTPPTSCFTFSANIIYMTGNKITHFKEIFEVWNLGSGTMYGIGICLKVNNFVLLRNHLNCDCIDYGIYKYMQENQLFYRYFGLLCYEPISLRGENINFLNLDQLICNITEKCPDGCACIESPVYKNMSIHCNRYTNSKLPSILPKVRNKGSVYCLHFNASHLHEISLESYMWNTETAYFSHSSIRRISLDALFAFQNILSLQLNHNKLERLPGNLTKIKFKSDTQLYFGDNPWVCDCEAFETKDWMLAYATNIKDKESIVCHSPSNMENKKMIGIDKIQFCPPESMTKYVIIGTLSGVLALFLSLSICVVSRNRTWIFRKTGWHPLNRDEAADEGKEFDVFVSYADEDEEYVGEYLIPELQNRGFKVCYHRVNFHAGKPITMNIFECIDGSKRTLVFFSNAFKQSDFCMWEFSVALELDLKEHTHRLITIKDTELDIDNLDITSRSYFKTSTYIEREAADFWENLLYSLPIERMGDPVQPPQPVGEEE